MSSCKMENFFEFIELFSINKQILPGLNEDERIVQVVGELNSRYTGADYTRKEGEPAVKPEMIKPDAGNTQ